MCKDAAPIQSTDKVNHASDAIAKCGLDFKMDYLQKPDALAQSHLSTGADKTNLPDLTIIQGGPAHAAVPQGDDNKASADKAHGMGYKPDTLKQLDEMDKYQSKALPNDGLDHDWVKKYSEAPAGKHDLQIVPDAELETKIRHH